MGLFRKTEKQKAAIAEMKVAHQALEEHAAQDRAAGIRHETEKYHRLNDAAAEAASRVWFWHGGDRGWPL